MATATVPVTLTALPTALPVPPCGTVIIPDTAEAGIVAEAVTALVPVPSRYPVSVVAPVPPLGTGTVLSVMDGVVVPVATTIGEVPVTLVTVPGPPTELPSGFQAAETES